MPHFPKPFFRPKKNRWYVQLDGKHVNLGPDEKEAFRRYHEIMAARKQPIPVTPPSDQPLLVEELDAFLDWCLKHRAKRTFESYEERIKSFLDSLADRRMLLRGRQATRVAAVISYSCCPCPGRAGLELVIPAAVRARARYPPREPDGWRSGERVRRMRGRTGAARHLPPGSSSPKYCVHSWQMGWKARGRTAGDRQACRGGIVRRRRPTPLRRRTDPGGKPQRSRRRKCRRSMCLQEIGRSALRADWGGSKQANCRTEKAGGLSSYAWWQQILQSCYPPLELTQGDELAYNPDGRSLG